ncbi:ATP-grasp domain-containing protein [Mycoplasmatota bacterium]|nr:ATP-grasp domain-containing protein [Mycoplasmatota bacterium]
MRAIIFINTTESGTSREVLKSAKRLGYKVILFTDNSKQDKERHRFTEVDELIYLEYLSYGDIKSYIERYILHFYEISAILSFLDGYVGMASRLADDFTDNILSSKALEIMENKLKTRMFFKDDSFTPKFSSLKDLLNKSHLNFPVVYKECTSTGSKGVKKINSKYELTNFVTSDAFIEEYIPGQQYMVEVLVKNSNPKIIAKIKQIILQTSYDTFIVKGYSLDKDFKLHTSEKEMINKIVSKLKIKNGHIHIEYKMNKDGVKLIEINPRISGAGMHALLEEGLGINYTDQMLKFYLKEDIQIPKLKNNCYAHYFLSNKGGILSRVTGRAKSIIQKDIKRLFIKPKQGQFIRLPKSMANRYGYIIGTGRTIEEARTNTLKASKNIKFHLVQESYLNLILFILLVLVLSLHLHNL